MYKSLTIFFLFFLCAITHGQDTARSNVIFQVEEKSKFKEKILSNDTAWLFVEYAFDSLNFGIEKFPAKVIGKNKSMVLINLPDTILNRSQYIKISSPGKVACARCPASSDYIELLSSDDKLFDFKFNSSPEGADLYLIPLYDCKSIFNTTKFEQIKIDQSVLPNISSHKIPIKPTPLTVKVSAQPYVAIFAIFDSDNNITKLNKMLIRPNRNYPDQNTATGIIR